MISPLKQILKEKDPEQYANEFLAEYEALCRKYCLRISSFIPINQPNERELFLGWISDEDDEKAFQSELAELRHNIERP